MTAVPGFDDDDLTAAVEVITACRFGAEIPYDARLALMVEYKARKAPVSTVAMAANILLSIAEERIRLLFADPEALRLAADAAAKGSPLNLENCGLSADAWRGALGEYLARQS